MTTFKDLSIGDLFILTGVHTPTVVFKKTMEEGEHNAVWHDAEHIGESIPDDMPVAMVTQVTTPKSSCIAQREHELNLPVIDQSKASESTQGDFKGIPTVKCGVRTMPKFTTHALFPVKLLAILDMFINSKRGAECMKQTTHYIQVQQPVDDKLRAVMSSPPLFDVINNNCVGRIRLAFKPDDMLAVYETALELYSVDGELLHVVKNPEWSLPLSLAIEAELLERILDVNPL